MSISEMFQILVKEAISWCSIIDYFQKSQVLTANTPLRVHGKLASSHAAPTPFFITVETITQHITVVPI